MPGNAPSWIETAGGRNRRTRRAALPVPEELSPDLLGRRELLVRWVRDDRRSATRTKLLAQAGDEGIERAEATCEMLLREGWIELRERFEKGSWQWHALDWRDLERLQQLLGVRGRRDLRASREQALDDAKAWLRARTGPDALPTDPHLLEELAAALAQLAEDRSSTHATLHLRLTLLRAVADWQGAGKEGLRRDFALRACGDTKAIGAADWRWLESSFDLERLRIAAFAPQLWLAGDASLLWRQRRLDLSGLHCIGLSLEDTCRIDRVVDRPSRYWLIENRASFERQARALPPGVVLLWMPGRPSLAWQRGVRHLLSLAPGPAWISADADPSGVDIACSTGAIWMEQGLEWSAHRMGLPEWELASQRWPLSDYDRTLLDRLLARDDLPADLRVLCECMRSEGRKAEQEGWL